jgi:hypothetical protein
LNGRTGNAHRRRQDLPGVCTRRRTYVHVAEAGRPGYDPGKDIDPRSREALERKKKKKKIKSNKPNNRRENHKRRKQPGKYQGNHAVHLASDS